MITLKNKRATKRLPTVTEGLTMTLQAPKAECDVNNIVQRYQQTGIITHVQKNEGHYRDMDGDTLQDHMNKVAQAKSNFENLPSKTRAYFGNNPITFLDWASKIEPGHETQAFHEIGLLDAKHVKPDPKQQLELERAVQPEPSTNEISTATD
jgi:hypothetical protein